jgi:hypothetical protein
LQYYRECGRGRQERPEFQYYEKVLNLDPIAYWPLWEASGTTAHCLVNTAQNGIYNSDVSTWPVGTGIGDGNTAPQFDGTNDYLVVETATLEAAINGAEGTYATWFQVSAAGVWTDGIFRYMCNMQDDANNRFVITKSNANNTLYTAHYAGGTAETHTEAGQSSTAWMHYALTWSETADEVKYYLNGVLLATDTTIGTWNGDADWSPMIIGAASGAPANVWSGGLAHCAFWGSALGAGIIADLATV